MGITRAVFVCVILYNAVKIDALTKDLAPKDNLTKDGRPRVSHRVQLLFPLLLRISTRLATLIPTAIMGLIGIFLFVAFSKKAFVISLLALFLTYLDKYKRDEENVVHIHKINLYDEDEVLAHNEEHLHYGLPYRKRVAHIGKYPLGYRPWPKVFYRYPLPYKPPPELDGLRRRNDNRTVPSDFREFLYRSIDAGGTPLRYIRGPILSGPGLVP